MNLDDLIVSAAGQHGLPQEFLKAQIMQESAGRPDAVSPVGAIGLMQILPKAHPEYKGGFDPEQNIQYGSGYMRQLLDQFNDPASAIAAYNAGPGRVKRLQAKHGEEWRNHLPKETQDYLAKLLPVYEGSASAKPQPKAVSQSRTEVSPEEPSEAAQEAQEPTRTVEPTTPQSQWGAALGLLTDTQKNELAKVVEAAGPSDQEQYDAATADATVGFGEALRAGFRLDNSGWAIYQNATAPRFSFDSAFDPVEYMNDPQVKETLDRITLANREEMMEQLGSSYNQEQFDYLLHKWDMIQEDEMLVAKAKGKGMLARISANIADPLDLAVTAVAAPVAAATRATRVGRIIAGAATAGVANAGIEASVANDNPFRDESDVLFATAAGIVMGGALSSLSRAENLSVEDAANKLAEEALARAEKEAAERVQRETSAPDAEPRVVETRGLDRVFHGTSRAFENDITSGYVYTPENLYGPGFYTTDAADVALGYTKKGGGDTPTVYEVDGIDDLNFFDLDGDIPDFIRGIDEELDYVLSERLAEGRPITSMREAYAELQETFLDRDFTAEQAEAVMDDVNMAFRKNGYDGFTHVGGANSNKYSPHKVRIVFEPEKLKLRKVDEADLYEGPVAREGTDDAGAARRVLTGEDTPAAESLAKSGEDLLNDLVDESPTFRFHWLDRLTMNLRGKINTAAGRGVYAALLEGGFLRNKKGTRRFSAEGTADGIERAMATRFIASAADPFKRWAKANNYTNVEAEIGQQAGREFFTQVGLALRGIDDAVVSAEAKEAAAAMRAPLNDIYDRARAAGVKGFEAPRLDDYFPRMYDKRTFNNLIVRELGTDAADGRRVMTSFFKEAILSAQDDIPEELAETFARSMVRTVHRSAGGFEAETLTGLSLDDMDRLREIFTDGLDGNELQRAIDDFESVSAQLETMKKARNADAGKDSRVKRRVLLDEGYTAPVKRRDGTTQELKFYDFLQNDARAVGGRYIQRLAGLTGIAEELGVKSHGEFEKLLDGVRSYNIDQGVDPRIVDDEVNALRRGYKLIVGESVEENPHGIGSQLSRGTRDINFVRSSGAFGLAQIAEFGNPLAAAGIRSFLRHMSEFFTLNKRAVDGTLDNAVLRQAEEWFAPGTDFIRNPAIKGFDEFGEGFDEASATSRTLAAIDAPVQVAKRGAAVASLMAPLVTRMEKMAVLGHTDEWVKMGKAGVIPARKAARWRGAGLDDDMQLRVLDAFRNHVKYDERGRIVDYNVADWPDDVAKAYGKAMRRQASFTIQRNDIADPPEFIRGPIGRLALQFKSFMFGSIVKQLERGVHYADIETGAAWMSSVFFAGVTYTAQTYLETFGDPELRKEKLTPQMIAGAAFSRAGFTALLVPPAATLAELAGYDQMFNHRYSGLQSSLLSLDQNPTSQLIRSAFSTANALTLDNLDPEKRGIQRQDVANAMSLLPFNRVLGVKNVQNIVDE